MNRKQEDSSGMMWGLLTFPVAWMGAALAYVYVNVFDLMGRFAAAMERPFAIGWTSSTPHFMLGALVLYGFAVTMYLSSKENRRPGEEHGSAKWGNPRQLCAKYQDKDPMKNTLLTQNVRMGLNGKVHWRNLLQIVIGGSGAGKSHFFCKPNLMQANCSFIVTDPKGEMPRAVAPLLLEEGYEIKVFDLIDPEHSNSFNPFSYIRDDKNAMKLVNNLIEHHLQGGQPERSLLGKIRNCPGHRPDPLSAP